MKQVIRNIYWDILFECEAVSFKEAVEKAVRERVSLNKADLRYADLRDAELAGANLSGADLFYADFRGANLSGADLSDTRICNGKFSKAVLRNADLSGADFYRADLYKADLRGANIRGVYFSDADLIGADLTGAKFNSEPQEDIRIVPKEGEFIGWKKCSRGVIVKLLIPADAKRSNAFSRKCRASKAVVLEVIGASYGVSNWDGRTIYRLGETVYADKWVPRWWDECTNGIHFFMTRKEAEDYCFFPVDTPPHI